LVKPDCLKAMEMVCLWSGAPTRMWKCRVTRDIILMLWYKWESTWTRKWPTWVDLSVSCMLQSNMFVWQP